MGLRIKVYVETAWKAMNQVIQRRDIVVVVDVLRASTTVVNAFANGAVRVYPVETIREAWAMKRENPEIILCGERGGLRPRGFELGNSPLEYTSERVRGRWLVMTTTDGTRAMNRARATQRPVLVGACINSAAAARRAFELAGDLSSGVSIVAVGRKGDFSLEDFLCAGLIAGKMPEDGCDYSDAALAAISLTEDADESFPTLFNKSSHASELKDIGLGRDVVFASNIDKFRVVPMLERGASHFKLE
jgi:2-phosphosulfolactate phosphatase